MADDVEMTPITPAESSPVPPKVAPFGASANAPAAPSAAPSPSAGVSTIKLKPVIRKPQIHKPVVGGSKPPVSAPAAAASAAAVKKATQNLKAVTGPIPMQATLRKTGIIAEGILTPAQQQAAKSKTSRISLESAIGVAPAKEGPAPLKTIRLRRPTDLKPRPPAPSLHSRLPRRFLLRLRPKAPKRAKRRRRRSSSSAPVSASRSPLSACRRRKSPPRRSSRPMCRTFRTFPPAMWRR